MKNSVVEVIFIFCVLLFISACSDVDPTNPGEPGPDTLVVEAQLIINGGSAFTGDPVVSLAIAGTGADSVMVFNAAGATPLDVQNFELTDGKLEILNWELGGGEGPKSVGARFRKDGLLDSAPVTAEIILDMTPPNVQPAPIKPDDGKSDISTGLGFSWSPAEDELDAGPLNYRVMSGRANPPVTELWSGSETQCLVPGLEKSSTYYWQVIAVDAAGNEGVGPVWSFATWDLDIPVFRLIPAGSFIMGSPESELGHSFDEDQHEVTLTRSFLIGETQLTEGNLVAMLQWAQAQNLVSVRGDTVFDSTSAPEVPLVYVNNSLNFIAWNYGVFFSDEPNIIATGLAWYCAAIVGEWLNIASNGQVNLVRGGYWDFSSGGPYENMGYRLPTEAEWEYSCRAGSTTAFANGEITDPDCWDPVLDQIGWFCGNAMHYDWTPALKIPNKWGLYDMHGGYPEWCWDWIAEYPLGPISDPVNPHQFNGRILRGGLNDLTQYATWCRSAKRWSQKPEANQWSNVGFRLVFSLGGSGTDL